MTPTYPVIVYSHDKASQDSGDAIANGYVYNGKIAALREKLIFGDITTGESGGQIIPICSLQTAKGSPATMAPIHRVKILWDSPAGRERAI